MTTVDMQTQQALDALYADLAVNNLQPLWTQAKELVPFYPKPATLAWLWKWQTLQRLASRAGELVTVERGGERRVLILSNPGLQGKPFTTPTIIGTVQYLNPNEKAPAHRHTAGAIRFVMQGEGVSTTVNGDSCDMHPGDLIVTPNWSWHDHINTGTEPVIWFDGLDDATGLTLDAIFFEPYPEYTQKVEKPFNVTTRLFGGRGVLPLGMPAAEQTPLHVYRRADTDAALTALLEANGGPCASIQYVNPTTGKAVLLTLGCEMHRIVPGKATQPYRKVGNSVFVVFEGSGFSIINGRRFDWSKGDMFVVPSWATVEYQASETADLFAVTDRPMLEALGWFREEFLSQPQKVTDHFQAQ
jgi:gentisate 1,2-dioxygenase